MKNVRLYRICTEDVGADRTREIIGRHFDGFTLLYGEGFYKGVAEKALVIEILGGVDDPTEPARINALCEDLKVENHQEAVLVEVLESANYLI